MMLRGWLSVVLLTACGPAIDVGQTDGVADDDGTTEPTTGAMTMTAATDASVESGSPTSSPMTAATTATTTEPAGCDTDFVIGCQSFCATNITCHPDEGPYEECVTDCVDSLVDQGAECQVAMCDALSCLGTLDCPTFDNGDPTCEALAEATDSICDFEGETCYYGSGRGFCEHGCGDRVIRCDTTTCECFDGDEQTASCPSENICASSGDLEDLAQTCCGW